MGLSMIYALVVAVLWIRGQDRSTAAALGRDRCPADDALRVLDWWPCEITCGGAGVYGSAGGIEVTTWALIPLAIQAVLAWLAKDRPDGVMGRIASIGAVLLASGACYFLVLSGGSVCSARIVWPCMPGCWPVACWLSSAVPAGGCWCCWACRRARPACGLPPGCVSAAGHRTDGHAPA